MIRRALPSPIVVCSRAALAFFDTDAGREVRYPHEYNDCTVRALASASGTSYHIAHKALEAAGRDSGEAFHIGPAILAHSIRGYLFSRVWIGEATGGRETLGHFLETHSRGRFFVRKRLHCFAVVGGIIHDDHPRRPNEIITDCWTVQRVPLS